VDDEVVSNLCERFQLDLGQRFREYSRGNKQKLAIVLGFMHQPRLLVFDEPTGGLDPLNQQAFYDMCQEAKAGGATVFLSSHILSEVEHISDRVAIIRGGRLVRLAKIHELHEMRVHQVEIEFGGKVPLDRIRAAKGVDRVEADDHRVSCVVRGSFEPLMKALAASDIVNLTSHEPNLEEVFLQYYRDGSGQPANVGEEAAAG
jgi:ABC-2 type transport system ATP-binding protein